MTATDTRRVARRDKRRLILDAAAPIFGDEGYERASIDAIAASAGVSKPTIYSYFGGKEQLFRESVADSALEQNAQVLEVIQRLDLSAHGWLASLRELGMKLVECQRTPCAVFLARMIAAETARDPEVYRVVRAKAMTPILESLAGRLAMLGNAGHLTVPDPALAARQFLALISAEIPELTEHGTRTVPDDRVRAAVDAGLDTFLRAHARREQPAR
ncbi:TetR/AcrR family transcriptional regulator [Frankia sp. CNm7]|uniref:TetR/AcrR family transcriptional regulator n=1 Tax=Frankia nepalensis TaxID=1836974 RepID=A0A937UTE2_9ACTN|nr:TetR/AcrR family transcriptional regulator [Frankia nepalensis]MBL7497918.1 TetR/AcrR family transcriptional regulator [Frankia nepalensis]MBL7512713.1 TetR/AcrR family transcriptional regulator [Frankia nepalensis]MBL7519541.1 TetR/AcrR family transcriptional regulator [Frankia nepalensis]MBL7629926.1 TetR/AcrR family transcriptional regulator [Frankia nepalensis]